MTSPIQLSLAGDRRLVILTAKTVRKAYFQFTSVNPEYTSRRRYRLQTPLYHRQDLTLLDVLHRFPKVPLHAQDIRQIETEINAQIVGNNFALVDDEGHLRTGDRICHKVGQNRHKIQYIIRYGLIFILEPTMKSKVLSMKNTDLFWQDLNFDFHYVRYCGLLSSIRCHRIVLLFRDRLDLAKSWTCSLEEFQPRQVFAISAIYPCEGFAIQL
jgi:hypothetical protein